MQRPWESHMLVGIVHPMAYPEAAMDDAKAVETAYKILADDFFGAIEIKRMEDKNRRKELKRLLGISHVEVVFGGQGSLLMNKLDLGAEDEMARQAAIVDVKKSIDEAYEMGAKIVATLSGPDAGEGRRERAKELLVDSFKQVCKYAQAKATDYTITVSIENFDRKVDKKLLIGPTAEAAEIAKLVKEECANFGLTIDLSHLPLLDESYHDALSVSIEHLVHVHIGNCVKKDPNHPVYGDQHPRFGIAGGENDVDEVRRFLESLIYVGYFQKELPTCMPVVSFEVKPLPGEPSELVIANAKRVFKEAWAKL